MHVNALGRTSSRKRPSLTFGILNGYVLAKRSNLNYIKIIEIDLSFLGLVLALENVIEFPTNLPYWPIP